MSIIPNRKIHCVTHRRHQDIAYRVGFTMQALGAAVLAILYPLGNPFYSLGIMLFEAGVLLAALSFFLENSWAGKIVGAATLAGIALQAYGLYAPEEYAGPIILGGIGFVCAGAAGIAGKEACCSQYREGWILMLVLPALGLANLLGKENLLLNAAGFAILFLALLSLTGKKLRQPLAAQALNSCEISPGAHKMEP